MTKPTYALDRETHNELKALIEDSVQSICDEYRISGELAWLVVECLSTAKLAQLRGEID